jgi:hypothetical protein
MWVAPVEALSPSQGFITAITRQRLKAMSEEAGTVHSGLWLASLVFSFPDTVMAIPDQQSQWLFDI